MVALLGGGATMVKCSECGFLSARNKETRNLEEIESGFRQSGDIRTQYYLNIPVCFAMAFNFNEEFKKLRQLPKWERKQVALGFIGPPDEDLIKELLNTERNCEYFTKYQQGFTPKEHREMMDRKTMLEMEEKRKQDDRKWHWIELAILVVGAGLFTLLGAWLAK
jgi:hypothetical protein